ncbi:MAG TPA: MOSC domain-containing protein [Bryobacteraceae bacterium]|nr:MOSC domain-containing protein [Bryobacteraceae bacterium]
MNGTILQVNISPGGLPKRPVREALLSPLGFEGDAHAHPKIHGGPAKAILLIPSELTDLLIARGFPLFYGALGENLTTQGIDIRSLMPRMRLRCGAAVIETTQLRRPCNSLDVYGASLRPVIEADPALGGWYASVVIPGHVRGGDPVAVLDVAV